MKNLPVTVLLALCCSTGVALASGGASQSAPLQKLGVSIGHWVYHGKTLATAYGKAGTWTWNEHCSWSHDRMFLLCSFDNAWNGKAVKSLVIDTYNSKDHGYWHYELYATGQPGAKPFISRMTIAGNTWTEYAQDKDHGKKISTRIVYHYRSATVVDVAIQVSRDGNHWVTVDQGRGMKQP